MKMKIKTAELLARFTIGYVFIESGLGKFKDMPKVVEYFQSLNIPLASIQAPFVSTMELLCGALVLLGLLTRAASVFLVVVMLVALGTAKREELVDVSSLLGMIEFLYIVILGYLIAQGSQFFSIDAYLQKKNTNKYLQWILNL
jgi:putative oxidoreductase